MRRGFVKGRKRADQQHHRNLREAFIVLNRAAKLVAVQARHEYIGKDNIRCNMFKFFQRQPAVANGHYFHAFVSESQFNDFLHNVTEQPDKAINEVPLLSDQERRLVLEEWNKTDSDFPS